LLGVQGTVTFVLYLAEVEADDRRPVGLGQVPGSTTEARAHVEDTSVSVEVQRRRHGLDRPTAGIGNGFSRARVHADVDIFPAPDRGVEVVSVSGIVVIPRCLD